MCQKFYANLILRSLLTAFAVTAIYFINPFGLRSAAVKYNEDIVIRLMSPLHGEKGTSEVVIVLIDDNFIHNYGMSYPVPYPQLSSLFSVISHHQPTAVFLDIIQKYEHSSGLEHWIETIGHASFPVFMAGLPSVDTPKVLGNEKNIRHKLNNVSEFTTVGWSGYNHYYPLKIPNPHYTDADPASDKIIKTAAFDLYRVWCKKKPDICSMKVSELDEPSQFNRPMIVRWSNRAAAGQETFIPLSKPCQIVSKNEFEEIWSWVKLELKRSFPNFNHAWEKRRHTCFNIMVLQASSLLDSDAGDPEGLIGEQLHGKIVMVGYNIKGSSDIVTSPLHGPMPGIFIHAMALDNLINYDNEYWHVPKPIVGTLSIADLLDGGLQFVVLIFFFYFRMWHTLNASRNFKTESFWQKGKILFFIVILFFCISLWACFQLRFGVYNWIVPIMTMLLLVPTMLIEWWRKKFKCF